MFYRVALFIYFLFFHSSFCAAQSLDHVVAVVNNSVITASELTEQVEVLRQQLTAQRVELPSDAVLRKQVLQHLIDVDLEVQMAKQHDIKVEDDELNDAVAKIAANNHLTIQELKNALKEQGLEWKAYLNNIRKEMTIARLQQQAVGKDIVVTNEQVEDYIKTAPLQDKAQIIYHLQNIVIPLPEEPTPEDLKKANEKARMLLDKIQKGEDFSRLAVAESSGEFALEGGDLGDRHLAELPELFAKKVVNMQEGQVVGPLRAGNGYHLIKLVSVQGNNNGKHEVIKTHVRHILLKQDGSVTPAETEKQANNLYQQLKSGKPFELMAKQYSVDVTSAVKGGDLGWVNPGELVPEFEKVMDKLPLHVVSRPVKTGYGWHLIEVLERKKEDDSEAFKRQQVRQFLQQRKFMEAVQNWQQHVRAQAYVQIMDKDLA